MGSVDKQQGFLAPLSQRDAYIVGPTYDWLLFLLPPLVALSIGYLVSDSWISYRVVEWGGYEETLAGLLIGVFIHAHLFAVFFRSHGNPTVFSRFKARFLVVPPLLFLGMVTSNWVLISVSVLATFWDVYHSALQTFGFARIYDAKQGNDPSVSRRLDWWLNQLLYAGPILAGATMLDHFQDFNEFEAVGAAFFTTIPVYMEGYQKYYAWAVIYAGCMFLFFYTFTQIRLAGEGYRISPLKVFLLVSTGLVSIFAWGFNSWGEAFLIMNFFHALQYFGIVWARERGNMLRLLRLKQSVMGYSATLLIFLSVTFGYGLWVETLDTSFTVLWAITLTVSIMHFWYDGFIWSVQKNQV